jgi:hypothetical protein
MMRISTAAKKAVFVFILPLAVLCAARAEERYAFGTSATRIEIAGYTIGRGADCVAGIGGIHGRYEENTAQLAGKLVSYLRERETELGCTVKVVENLNPDGFLYQKTDAAVKRNGSLLRFNADGVDLNRNWDTPDWTGDVSYARGDFREGAGGASPMSEPEIRSLAGWIDSWKRQYATLAVIMLHSYSLNSQDVGGIFPAYRYGADGSAVISADVRKLAACFTESGDFAVSDTFHYYAVPGEFAQWCGIRGIAAVDVELGDDGDVFSARNIAARKNGKSHWQCFIDSFTRLLARYPAAPGQSSGSRSQARQTGG